MNISGRNTEEGSAKVANRAGKAMVRYAVAVGSALAIITAGGIAWATWTNTATGTAGAGAGTLTLTASAGSNPTNKLWPGVTAGVTSGATAGGDLVLSVTNNQSLPIKITSVTQNGAITQSGGSGTPACTSDTGTSTNISALGNSGVYVSATAPAGVGGTTTYTTYSGFTAVTVSANTSNVAVTIPNAVTMTSSSANGCQGATFSIPVVLGLSN